MLRASPDSEYAGLVPVEERFSWQFRPLAAINPLQTTWLGHGTVRSRVALLLRSTEVSVCPSICSTDPADRLGHPSPSTPALLQGEFAQPALVHSPRVLQGGPGPLRQAGCCSRSTISFCRQAATGRDRPSAGGLPSASGRVCEWGGLGLR